MTKEEHREYLRKYRAEHREEYRARMRKRYAEHQEEKKSWMRKYQARDLNKKGVSKNSIRSMSWRILERCLSKLPGYEIHHCFGYEDPEKFIYIPKSLHLKVHQFLRDNGITSNTDHWNYIRDLVNSCEEYTYIKS